jgi:hypothetical protein
MVTAFKKRYRLGLFSCGMGLLLFGTSMSLGRSAVLIYPLVARDHRLDGFGRESIRVLLVNPHRSPLSVDVLPSGCTVGPPRAITIAPLACTFIDYPIDATRMPSGTVEQKIKVTGTSDDLPFIAEADQEFEVQRAKLWK